MIPQKGLAFDLEAHQAVSVHPRGDGENCSNRVFSFFKTSEVSSIVGAHKKREPAVEGFVVRFLPELHRFEAVPIDSVKRHSRIEIPLNLFHGQKSDGAVQPVVNGSDHFSGRKRRPEFPVKVDDATVDSNVNACIGSTGEHQKLLFLWPCEPFEGTKHPNQFTLDGTYVGLYLAPVESVSEVADSEKQPNLFGQ